jgi:hypothetical protein
MTAETEVTLAQCVELLETRRLRVCDELAGFAQPVAACDADFNTLLAERAAIVQALAQLRPLARAEAVIPHPREDGPLLHEDIPLQFRNRRREDHEAHAAFVAQFHHPDLFNGLSSTPKNHHHQGHR